MEPQGATQVLLEQVLLCLMRLGTCRYRYTSATEWLLWLRVHVDVKHCQSTSSIVVQVGSICVKLGKMTNNQAEYYGLLAGVEAARVVGVKKLRVLGDSQLVVRQVGNLPSTVKKYATVHCSHAVSTLEAGDTKICRFLNTDALLMQH